MRTERTTEAAPDFEPIDIPDIRKAREYVRETIENGNFPVMTIPKQYAAEIRKGLVPHATWIGMPLLAGTLMREPYLPDGEERVIVRIKVDPKRVEPRFTGPDKHYHGIVVFKGPISPEEIEEIPYGSFN